MPYIFWKKYSYPSQNALNPHLFPSFSSRIIGFWEEMDFFVQESSVFERKWTFLSKNRWFLRGNRLFYARTVGFCGEMTIYSKKHPGDGDKMTIYSKSLLDIQFCIYIFVLFFLIFL